MKKVRQQEAGFGSGKFPSYKKCTHPLFFVLILSLKSKMYNLGDPNKILLWVPSIWVLIDNGLMAIILRISH